MNIGYELKVQQVQTLSMTPELIQAIQILQFNNQELCDYIDNELLENPVLEGEAMHPLETYDINERLLERGTVGGEDYSRWDYRPSSEDEDYSYENFVAVKYTLSDFLLSQLHLSDIEGKDVAIGRYIIEGIDDNGYLTMSIKEIAEETGSTEEDAQRVLDMIQTFEPSGVGARNLSECLKIQLSIKDMLTDKMDFIIENMLEDIAENRLNAIAKTLGIKVQQVQEMADVIKSLDPKPGKLYDSEDDIKYIVPDIFVEKDDGEYIVTYNDGSCPKLMISSYYKRLSSDQKNDEELKSYLTNRFNAATWLIRSIEQRKETIYNVASAVVDFQKDFFEHGEKHLRPLTLKQVAEKVGVHESTVSRSINGKYMQSYMGVYELKYFFTSGVLTDDGAGVSSNSVKALIKSIIEKEDPKKPYSDQIMAEMLKKKGIEISRRTVAKYREDMNILSSSKRRRF